MKNAILTLTGLTLVMSLFPGCRESIPLDLGPGTSKSLADHRKATISDVSYEITFRIPENKEEAVEGRVMIIFHRTAEAGDLVLDFKGRSITNVSVGAEHINGAKVENEHLIIGEDKLVSGYNAVSVEFFSSDEALNRNDDFMYALFVPDKASTAYPCFDQPNIKARYTLYLVVPEEMVAFSNYSVRNIKNAAGFDNYTFNETAPISTYLFSFGVGHFQSITETVDGREMTLYHRETDADKVAKNAPVCFDLHAKALAWLEDYTGIPYPFEQFNFALIPAFQFGGMEHPGAIWYKARSLFLDDNATVNQKMARNSLIAHETAHMWFGDLVTMDWFDDVWLKEVYANFMAAKMVNPNFPEIDHDLRFLLRHQPSAYGEDRTAGSHAIQQQLDNLNEASLLYGRIIYQKAPVVMNQLESIIGEKEFQLGLQEYLKTYSLGNATWDDLIAIMDKRTDLDLNKWSQAWVKESGMPHYKANVKLDGDEIESYSIDLINKTSGGNIWQQNTTLITSTGNSITSIDLSLFGQNNPIEPLSGITTPDFIIPSVSEKAYGYFELDKKSEDYLLENVHNIKDDLTKSSAWFSLWESFLRNKISADQMMQTVITALPYENDVQGLTSRLGYLRTIYWGFTNDQERQSKYLELGESIWQLMNKVSDSGQKKVLYDAFANIALQESDVARLISLWNKTTTIKRLTLSENDFTNLAYQLAIRGVDEAEDILNQQLERISNPDRKAEMAFVIPALSSDQIVRDEFFEQLKNKEGRLKESWVLTALRYLHHPLRAKSSEKYIKPSLEIVQEIQQTGSIFFPQRWVGNTLSGYSSEAAVGIFEEFVNSLPADYPDKLKNKILMQGDMLKRRAGVEIKN